MDKILWDKILAFDLDEPVSEYGFSTRIANENFWTENFTADAVLEYKRFMYLAATSDLMVSPSEIVDIVWHEHLIFTQSYDSFCNLLGKKIAHLPSTHNRQEFDKFKQAKERTKKLYAANFGEQPDAVWNKADMYDQLQLKKSNIKLRTLILLCVFIFCLLIPVAYILLKPTVSKIDNPYFLQGLAIAAVAVFTGLEIYNRAKLASLLKNWTKDSFIFRLTAMEVIFAAREKLSEIIHWKVNELVDSGKVYVSGNALMPGNYSGYKNAAECTILETLVNKGSSDYPSLLKVLKSKPVFQNTFNAVNAFKKYFHKSVFFRTQFLVNFITLGFVLMAAVTRVLTGISRDKPVEYILMTAIAITLAAAIYLYRITRMLTMTVIPSYYKAQVKDLPCTEDSGDWNYFIGSAVMAASFMPMVNQVERTPSSSGSWDSGSSSCGSGCGSSCGSSCGGCGGGD